MQDGSHGSRPSTLPRLRFDPEETRRAESTIIFVVQPDRSPIERLPASVAACILGVHRGFSSQQSKTVSRTLVEWRELVRLVNASSSTSDGGLGVSFSPNCFPCSVAFDAMLAGNNEARALPWPAGVETPAIATLREVYGHPVVHAPLPDLLDTVRTSEPGSRFIMSGTRGKVWHDWNAWKSRESELFVADAQVGIVDPVWFMARPAYHLFDHYAMVQTHRGTPSVRLLRP